ncbi:MAG: hypothetical protein ABIN58_04080 [candidate division WOR-3 bacterium]
MGDGSLAEQGAIDISIFDQAPVANITGELDPLTEAARRRAKRHPKPGPSTSETVLQIQGSRIGRTKVDLNIPDIGHKHLINGHQASLIPLSAYVKAYREMLLIIGCIGHTSKPDLPEMAQASGLASRLTTVHKHREEDRG